MKYGIYSIYDRLSSLYSNPEISISDGTAVRKFNYMMSNSHMVSSDCELYKVGEFDSITGVIFAFPKPVFVARYEEVK